MSPFEATATPSGPIEPRQDALDGIGEARDFQKFTLCVQGFEAGLAGLPDRYGPPGGCLLVSMDAAFQEERPDPPSHGVSLGIHLGTFRL